MTQPDEQDGQDNSTKNTTDFDTQKNTLVSDYEARMDEVAEQVARVRHEINNPLAALLGQAQLLLREELNDRARKRAETIEELAIRLRDVVAELRKIQKPAKAAQRE